MRNVKQERQMDGENREASNAAAFNGNLQCELKVAMAGLVPVQRMVI
jgi:hypothetical protein